MTRFIVSPQPEAIEHLWVTLPPLDVRRYASCPARRVAGHARSEEVGVAAEVLDRCERYRVDPFLDRGEACAGEAGDAVGERADEGVELIGRKSSIDPAVLFGELRVVVVGAQQNLERASATHQANEMLSGPATGEQAECRLELSEDGGLARGETQVAGQREFTPGAACPSLDLRDGHQATGTQMPEQQCERGFPD
jgi:hypothetical protein